MKDVSTRLRITTVDEFQLLTCLQHGLWGSASARFGEWREGDFLAISVDKALAALARVSGSPFKSEKAIWTNGKYPHRINIKFEHFLLPEHRPPLLGELREAFIQNWGLNYGWVLLNQHLLSPDVSSMVIDAITRKPNNLSFAKSNLESLMAAAKLQRQTISKLKSRVAPKALKVIISDPKGDPNGKPAESSLHTAAQSLLIELGKVTGSGVWIATNDQSRKYKGKQLSAGCLANLPLAGLNEDALKKISLIDVIWVHKGAFACAFEVETSTTIYSGLLRMSDLLAVVPSIKINLFVVAPRDRYAKFAAELSRATFQSIGLSEYCRFLPLEDLQKLLQKIGDLAGHIQPSVLDSIAVGLKEKAIGIGKS